MPKEIKCLICGKKISDEELNFEDYFSIFRGHNAQTWKGIDEAIEGFIDFDCMGMLKGEKK